MDEDRLIEALNKFKKRFPKTNKGVGDYLHGYLYLKYVHLYIRYMQTPLNKIRADYKGFPEKIKIDIPDFYDAEINNVMKTMVEWDSPALKKIETSEYHAKVLSYDDAQKLFSLKVDVNLPDPPKTMIPYDRARSIIIQQPDSIVVMECPCRTAQGSNGCYPRDVCMLFEPFGSLVLECAPEGNPRRITQEEALKIIKEEHERGHVHSAFFKDGCGDGLYAMCNCCNCCCACLSAKNYAGVPIMASSGYVHSIDYDKCQTCGTCVSVCNFNAVSIVDDKTVVNYDKCFGCGACQTKCPNDAISMNLDPAKGEPMDMHVILEKYVNKE